MDAEKIRKMDEAVIAAAKGIKVLSSLAWPVEAEDKFLNDWRKGKANLPKINIQAPDLTANVETLDAVTKSCDLSDPVEKFLGETARCYANAGNMIMNVGTPEFTRYSMKIYGRPDMLYKLQGLTAVDGARFFLDITDKLLGNPKIEPTETDISATEFASWLKGRVDEFFMHDTVDVLVDETLSAKALAGATRIRVRGGAFFSQLDKDQLLYHEAFVHTATQLNGQKQPNLKSLGLGSPRTTRTQEGIAVLSELITNSIDLTRLRRVALRVIAVKMALDGADFIDVFKFFLEAGQSEAESVKSAQRIFRGGAVKDGIVFTKDAVYLQGLLEVHTFFRTAIRDDQPQLVQNLFAGRMTMADVLRMNELFESGWLVPPAYIPTWASDLRRLAAMIAFSAFITNINLDVIMLDRLLELEEEIMRAPDA
ncbi:MAG: flavohemoglobin expression-modulating QEGLA motif protein [Methylicorpusculum sp.]|uniref:flavohemoglobin expression-modulating QEGLA motif protein n=1 Tax=Methylicorpusculum sp. TaxID=2713644 RepID=UPI002731DD82|nr:flavohemoglobin expression-modulating QEGLA motif protein [Methylicorpusculum sp.]MDP2203944.1 flavohemoglobin expression-modulating QEGLA motif protein [Methylicorpusculum sp.]